MIMIAIMIDIMTTMMILLILIYMTITISNILSGPWKLSGRFRCVSVTHVSVTFPLRFRYVSVNVSVTFPLGRCEPDGSYLETLVCVDVSVAFPLGNCLPGQFA